MQYSFTFQSSESSSSTLFAREPAAVRRASRDEILAAARQMLLDAPTRGEVLSTPDAVRAFLQFRLNASLQHEVFGVIFLTTQNQVIAYEELFRGTLNQATVYPREIVKAALSHNSAAVILAHNHPSGCAAPSRADVQITQQVKHALALVGTQVLDHLVIGDPDVTSMATSGML